jgi:hypothetical protein
MAQLRRDYAKFVERSAEVVAVGPEDYESFKVNRLKGGRMPAQFVIDAKGRIHYRHYGSSMSDIPSNDEMLQLLDQLNEEQSD